MSSNLSSGTRFFHVFFFLLHVLSFDRHFCLPVSFPLPCLSFRDSCFFQFYTKYIRTIFFQADFSLLLFFGAPHATTVSLRSESVPPASYCHWCIPSSNITFFCRWVEYFDKLYVTVFQKAGPQIADADPPNNVTTLSPDKGKASMVILRDLKPPGVCSISAEMLQSRNPVLFCELHAVLAFWYYSSSKKMGAGRPYLERERNRLECNNC